mmetsp:Transcript_19532/g.28708  ORF Transcript_19532/g.28708 Transcript_19532/m.28708 type:complete len:461 (+) Transcript_19532:147-1529(+)
METKEMVANIEVSSSSQNDRNLGEIQDEEKAHSPNDSSQCCPQTETSIRAHSSSNLPSLDDILCNTTIAFRSGFEPHVCSRRSCAPGAYAVNPSEHRLQDDVGFDANHDASHQSPNDDVAIETHHATFVVSEARVVHEDTDVELERMRSRLKLVQDELSGLRNSTEREQAGNRECIVRQRRGIAIAVILAITIIMIFVVTLTARNSPQQQRFDEVLSILPPAISERSQFKNIDSPQSKALHWIVSEDEAQLSITKTDRILQRYVLAVIFFSMGGEGWGDKCNFLTGKHECKWFSEWTPSSKGPYNHARKGVIACNEEDMVTNIQLYWNFLVSSIPDEVQYLSKLIHLNLIGGSISGAIPTVLGKLSNLKGLFLSNNNLSGSVPLELSNMEFLEQFSISMNANITGDMDFFCPLEAPLTFLQANCGGSSPEVKCACCNHCCDQEKSTCCMSGTDNCYSTLP